MDSMKDTVRQVVAGYAGKALNGYSYLTHSDDGLVFTIVDVARIQGKHIAGVSLVVRIAEKHVIVERDQNDKLVVDALVQAGIPRDKIILAYAGEPVPEIIS
jgi:hypothetical protein